MTDIVYRMKPYVSFHEQPPATTNVMYPMKNLLSNNSGISSTAKYSNSKPTNTNTDMSRVRMLEEKQKTILSKLEQLKKNLDEFARLNGNKSTSNKVNIMEPVVSVAKNPTLRTKPTRTGGDCTDLLQLFSLPLKHKISFNLNFNPSSGVPPFFNVLMNRIKMLTKTEDSYFADAFNHSSVGKPTKQDLILKKVSTSSVGSGAEALLQVTLVEKLVPLGIELAIFPFSHGPIWGEMAVFRLLCQVICALTDRVCGANNLGVQYWLHHFSLFPVMSTEQRQEVIDLYFKQRKPTRVDIFVWSVLKATKSENLLKGDAKKWFPTAPTGFDAVL